MTSPLPNQRYSDTVQIRATTDPTAVEIDRAASDPGQRHGVSGSRSKPMSKFPHHDMADEPVVTRHRFVRDHLQQWGIPCASSRGWQRTLDGDD